MRVIDLHQEQKQIIALAVSNNRQAQQQLYAKFSPKMLGVCRQYFKDLPQAEDVMLTAFMKVFSNLKHFEHKGSFEGWVRRIIVNECISAIRVQKKVVYLDDEVYQVEGYNEIESDFNVADIQYMIDNLPDGCRMVFNLYAIEGFKHKEIAVMLGINEGTSKSQLSHARKLLQQQMSKLKRYEYASE
jgi:RNA polymerase sigma-70 factor (ECF subfamily)